MMILKERHVVEVASSKEILRKRVTRLLRLDREENDQHELRTKIIPFLLSLGEVALIGGAIRDLARGGRASFASDLDFVVHGNPPVKFRDALARMNATPNRFGGYALNFPTYKIDVWHLEDTWARTAGLRKVEKLSDLLTCTFFDWDSVVFDLRSGQLSYQEGYLPRLATGVMDLCLEENPNPAGSVVRALRRAALWGVRFAPELSRFTSNHLCIMNWADLVARDRSAFAFAVLAHLDRDELIQRLESLDMTRGRRASFPIPDWKRQLPLPFPNDHDPDLSPTD